MVKQHKEIMVQKIMSSSELNNYLTDLCTEEYSRLVNLHLPKTARRQAQKDLGICKIQAEFYPYINLKLTCRKRGDGLFIRMSDMLTDAPRRILVAAANYILSRQFAIKCDEELRTQYRNYIHSDTIRKRIRDNRRSRAYKMLKGTKGKYFDLEDCFRAINLKYFNGELSMPTLTWSPRKSRRRFAHYDSDLHTIMVSRSLDNKNTPRYVVDYIIYHELLHCRYPTKYYDGRLHIHTPEFKHDERLFSSYDQAISWLKKRK